MGSVTGNLFAQTEKVDFGRDVLPILRENCVGGHGPLKQSNNFRLDRRSIAFRGGTRVVLIPKCGVEPPVSANQRSKPIRQSNAADGEAE